MYCNSRTDGSISCEVVSEDEIIEEKTYRLKNECMPLKETTSRKPGRPKKEKDLPF
jgi:hypothetical protein